MRNVAVAIQRARRIAAQMTARYVSIDVKARLDEARRKQEHTKKVEAVRTALIAGEQSGEPERFDFTRFSDGK